MSEFYNLKTKDRIPVTRIYVLFVIIMMIVTIGNATIINIDTPDNERITIFQNNDELQNDIKPNLHNNIPTSSRSTTQLKHNEPQSFSFDILDGYEEQDSWFQGHHWYFNVIAMRPPVDYQNRDFDLYVYTDSDYKKVRERSAYTGDDIEFVYLDGEEIGITNHYVKTYQKKGTGSYEIEIENSVNALSVPASIDCSFSEFNGVREVIDVFEVSLVAGKEYRIRVKDISKTINPNLYIVQESSYCKTLCKAEIGKYKSENSAYTDELVEIECSRSSLYTIIVTNEQGGNGAYSIEVVEVPPSTKYLDDDSPDGGYIKQSEPEEFFNFEISKTHFTTIGMRPCPDKNWDLAVATDSLFNDIVEESTRGTNCVDFVVLNGPNIGFNTYFAEVYQKSSGDEGSFAIEVENRLGDKLETGYSYSYKIGQLEVIDTYEIILSASTQYSFTLDVPYGVDLDIYLFDDTGIYSDAVASSTNYGTEYIDEFISFTPTTSGTYSVVIVCEEIMIDEGTYIIKIDDLSEPNIDTITTMMLDRNPVNYIYPIPNGFAFIEINVKQSSNYDYVTEGSLTLSTTGGTLETTSPVLINGIAWTKWHAPCTAGTYSVTAQYSDSSGGTKYYKPSTKTLSITVKNEPDDNKADIGVEWCNNYPDPEDVRITNSDSAEGLLDHLFEHGYSDDFFWSTTSANNNRGVCPDEKAWEEDFKKTSWPAGGTNNDYIDNVDIAMLASHGTITDDVFGYRGPLFIDEDHEDPTLDPFDANDAWGDKDLEWIILQGCGILGDKSRGSWARTLDGARLICGFRTDSSSGDYGTGFGDKLTRDTFEDRAEKVSLSWGLENVANQDARIIAESSADFDEWIWGQGYQSQTDPTDDSTYYYRTYEGVIGSRGSLNDNSEYVNEWSEMSNSQSGTRSSQLPNYKVIQKIATDEYTSELATDLGFTPGIDVGDAGNNLIVVEGHKVLRIPEASVGTMFYDDSIYSQFVSTQPNIPTPEDAILIADSFLDDNGFNRNGIQFDTITVETYQKIDEDSDQILNEIQTYYKIDYSRTIDGVKVVGPGGFMSVCVGENGKVIAFFETWRNIVQNGYIDIISAETALQLLNDRGAIVTLNGIPQHDDLIIINYELGYYERNFYEKQSYLQPVYIIHTDLIIGEETVPYDIYIPADATPPTATITSPLLGGIYTSSTPITFECTVTPGSGGTPPYEFEWRSDVDGLIGTEDCFTIFLSTEYKDPTNPIHTIKLTVTDKKGLVDYKSIFITVTVV